MSRTRLNIKKVIGSIAWSLSAIIVVLLLLAAGNRKGDALCKGIDVVIIDESDNFFIDKNDVLSLVNGMAGGKAEGQALKNIDPRKMEAALENDMWVRKAQLYFDDNDILHVQIEEREPIARVFTIEGVSFYLDTAATVLPLSRKQSARVPVFTGFPATQRFTIADSNLLKSVVNISTAIRQDDFLQAMIEQVNINEKRKFELIPKIGKQVIYFGDASFIDEKLTKLKAFYKNIIIKAGWNKYSELNLEFKNQIVAKLRGKEDIVADSVRTLELMELMAAHAQELAADSATLFSRENKQVEQEQVITESVERDDNPDGGDSITVTPAKPKLTTPPKAAPAKPVPKMVTVAPVAKPKPAAKPIKKPPKVVMPKRN